MRKHKASALDRIVACNGSPPMVDQASPREHDNQDAQEGTAFHEFSAKLFAKQAVTVGDAASNGYICDAEMLGYARDYVATFDAPQLEMRVEQSAHWSYGNPPIFEVRGKSDLVIFNEAARSLAIIDAKYGYRYVAPDNWQNVSYAIGSMMSLGPRAAFVEQIILGIYQPRIGGEPLRYAELTVQELHDKYTELTHILSTPSDSLVTGEHCRHCPAALGCPARRRADFNAIDVAMNADVYTTPADDMLRRELDDTDRALEALKQRKQLLEEQAKSALRDGRPLPGLASKPLLGNTAWLPNVETSTIRELGRNANVNFMDEEPCTPTEAKRRYKAAGRDPDELNKYTHRPDRGFKLVKQDATELAAETFGTKTTKVKKARGKKADT